MFDLPVRRRWREQFSAEVPGDDEPWDIGVIVGPSGSGKSTIAGAAFGRGLYQAARWPGDCAVIDCFGSVPTGLVTRVLTAVGLSSAPAWLKPHAVLSNGEKFRCELARALLNSGPLVVFDEFSSVVDRTVAKIASAAISKAIRFQPPLGIATRFVAVTCHQDVVDWLEPDWVLDMASRKLARGRLRRPPVELCIVSADGSFWPTFKRHHYMSGDLHRSARCYLGTIENRPAVFTAVLPHPHAQRPGWREHRTVCLPDFQGIGIGNAMSEFVASLYVASGRPYFSTTAHPGMIAHRMRSPLWRMRRRPGVAASLGRTSRTPGMRRTTGLQRITAGFEYIGARGCRRPSRSAEPGKRDHLMSSEAETSLSIFIREAWHVLEPATEFVPGWHLDAIARHLEAVTRGEIQNLLINLPPRHCKSLTVCVFWPVWEWIRFPHRRWLSSARMHRPWRCAILDCRRLIQSPWFKDRWDDRFALSKDQNSKSRFDNDRGGHRIATSVGGGQPGEGGDRVIVDDPHRISQRESVTLREAR